MPYSVKAVLHQHSGALQYHVVPGEEPVSVHATQEDAEAHALYLNSRPSVHTMPEEMKPAKRKKAKVRGKK